MIPTRTVPRLTLLGAALISCGVLADERCDVHLSESNLNYGHLTQSSLPPTSPGSGYLSFGKRVISLSSTCGAEALIGLAFVGDASTEKSFRFARHGQFTLKVLNAQLDGRAVRLGSIDRTATSEDRDLIRPGDTLIPFEGQRVAQGERLNLRIEVHTVIDEASSKVAHDETLEVRGHFAVKAM